jgi:hypothetical protein
MSELALGEGIELMAQVESELSSGASRKIRSNLSFH